MQNFVNIVLRHDICSHIKLLILYQGVFKMKSAFFQRMFLISCVAAFLFIILGEAGAIGMNDPLSSAKWTGIAGIFFAYITGVLLSFTPCVWPVYPITSSVIINSSAVRTKTNALFLSLTYVLGLAFTYSVLGAITGKMGALVSNYLKSVWVVIGLSVILVIFGLSMLGLFEIRIPASLSSKLTSGKRKGFIGVFTMGLISGLVLSPCITPVVGALIAFVIKSGSWITGAYLFFAFALGMGTILIVIGTASGALKTLPKPGKWMVRIKQVFGIAMIILAFYIAWPILASTFKSEPEKSPANKPATIAAPEEKPSQKAENKQIVWLHDLEKGLKKAKQENKPVFIDFTAEWCGYCKVLDKKTFPDKRVIKESRRFVMIKFDATRHTPETQAVLKEYQITGFPSLMIIDTKGKRHPLVGYVKPDMLLDFMRKAAPSQNKDSATPSNAAAPSEKPSKEEIKWVRNLREGLQLARMENKPVMIDMTADWCYYCKVLDKKTFPDKRVVEKSKDFVMIKFDATRQTPEVRDILAKYEVTGFPTLVFVDTKGEVFQLVGYVEPQQLLKAMEQFK